MDGETRAMRKRLGLGLDLEERALPLGRARERRQRMLYSKTRYGL